LAVRVDANGLCFFLLIFLTASLAATGVTVLVASRVADCTVFYCENCTVDLLAICGSAASPGPPTVFLLILGIWDFVWLPSARLASSRP